MNKITILLTTLILTSFRTEAFTISTESNCLGGGTYSYHFSEFASLPDYTVNVSEFALVPDLKMQIVNNPRDADLILADNLSNHDMAVCITQSAYGAKTINLSSFSSMPDITVSLSNFVQSPDYKIFINSTRFTKEQAAALFAVIWKSNQDQ